jgi:glyceraldehyde 3-phosphate dehydrogenase
MRIAINGMGRIGRLLFRRLVHHESIELVAVNDIMDTDNLAYLLKYDSVYGTFNEKISWEPGSLTINDKTIRAFREQHPSQLPWKELNIDVVLECSGQFTKKALAETHLQAGAGKVLLSTTGPHDIPLVIFGHNHHSLLPETTIVSPGGCMTNCSTHILYILNAIGVESAQLNILHSYTSRQELVDAPNKQFRRGRAAGESIIPVEIDLSQSLDRLLPALKHKVAAISTRIPVVNGAMADFTIQLKQSATRDEINRLFRTAAQHEYKGIIEYNEDPLVSLDIKGNTHSCIIDATLTSVVDNHLKLIAWFDNEYGFTTRMIDLLLLW